MVKYVLKRLGYSIVTLFVLVALTFFLQQCLPGDPFVGDKALPETTMAALRAKYGLDKSMPEQFLIYIGNCLHGDLGLSLNTNRPVTDTILDSFKVSFDLGIRAILFAFILGVVLGTIAAIKRGKAADTICMFIALIGVSVPSFIMASLLQYYLGLQLGNAMRDAGMQVLFATSDWGLEHQDTAGAGVGLWLAGADFPLDPDLHAGRAGPGLHKTARAKGLSQPAIIWRHALRNAITPVVTVLGPITAGVLTGAFVVENIFAIPGLGKYFVTSIQVLDYTMISGTTIFYGAFLILANLVVDLVYGVIDPRVKLEEG